VTVVALIAGCVSAWRIIAAAGGLVRAAIRRRAGVAEPAFRTARAAGGMDASMAEVWSKPPSVRIQRGMSATLASVIGVASGQIAAVSARSGMFRKRWISSRTGSETQSLGRIRW